MLSIVLLVTLTTSASFATMTLNCHKTFRDSPLTSRYNETIAHAVHSMTVQGLKLFSGKASSSNYVPTVNQDLSKSHMVLDHAPDAPLGHDFGTTTMNIIDQILTTLGNSQDGLGPHWSPIERVAHVFHMWDLWYMIKQNAWDDVTKSPPSDEMCTCLASVEFNGIKTAVSWVADHYKTGTPITLLDRPIPKLEDAATWLVWKQRLLHYYTPEALHDAAMYLYCVSQFW